MADRDLRPMITLFTAPSIPQLVASRLTALQSFDEGRGRRLGAGGSVHVTLAYIGPVKKPLAADIDTELAASAAPASSCG